MGAVGQAGQQIMLGQKIHALLGLHAGRQIAQRNDAVVIALARHVLGFGLYRYLLAVFVDQHGFIAVLAPAAHVLQRTQAQLGRGVIQNGRAAQLFQRIAGEPGQRVIAVNDDAVAVQHNGLRRERRKLAHALFAVAHLLLHLKVVADIGHQRHHALERAVRDMRAQHSFDMLHPATGSLHLTGVAPDLAGIVGQRLQLCGNLLPGRVAHNFARAAPHNGLRSQAKMRGITGIGKAADLSVCIKISQHGWRGIRDQSKNGVRIPGELNLIVVRHSPPYFLVFI